MGRAAVRSAIAAWFDPLDVAGLTTTYPSRPKTIPGTAFGLGAGAGSGAVLVIHLPVDAEKRIAVGGATSGEKFDVHNVAMEVLFQSSKQDALEAQADHDIVMDAIKARLRQDRTLGTAGDPIWQAGEGTTGIKVALVEPVLGNQQILINAVVSYEAWEFIQA